LTNTLLSAPKYGILTKLLNINMTIETIKNPVPKNKILFSLNNIDNKSIFSMEIKIKADSVDLDNVQLDSIQKHCNQIFFEFHEISSDIDCPR